MRDTILTLAVAAALVLLGFAVGYIWRATSRRERPTWALEQFHARLARRAGEG